VTSSRYSAALRHGRLPRTRRLDVSGLVITATTFPSSVIVTDLGSDTLVQIGSASILLVGVIGQGQNIITQDDFLLA
jgi:hypothetical protein